MKKRLAWWLAAGWLALPTAGLAQYITNVIVPSNSFWRVFRGVSEAASPTNAWRNLEFDEGGWEVLVEPLHYGTNQVGGDDELTDGTILGDMKGNYTTVYTRYTFVLTNASLIKNVVLRPTVDDGFVCWVNGGVSVRSAYTYNASRFDSLAYNTNATKDIEATNFFYGGIPGSILRNGTNVLAVQGINFARTNEDFRLNMQMEGLFTTNPLLRVAGFAPAAGEVVTNLNQLTVTFSQNVTNVRAADLWVNGQPASRLSGAGTVYTFGFAVADAQVVECAWSPTNNIRDTNGVSLGWQPPGWSYVQQVVYPLVQAVRPAAGDRVTNLDEVTVTFDRPVTNVNALDLLMNGVPAVGVTWSNRNYTFRFAGPLEGAVEMSWDPALEIRDTNNLPFVATNQTWSYTFLDLTPPYAMGLTPAPGTVVGRLTEARVTFSEPVSGVEAADLVMNGQPALEVVGSGSGPYVFQFQAPSGEGVVSFWWVTGHGIRDQSAARNLFPGGSWNVVLDSRLTSPVILSEFLAGNVATNGLRDENGELQDWIELNNRGTNPVRLLGWSLTDDDKVLDQWVFPDVTLQPGAYLVLFASGKDRRVVTGTNRMHLNFGLNPDGEYLGLFNADSPRQSVFAFSPKFPEQRSDYSYGVTPSNQWRYFQTPTPGAPNGDSPISTALPGVHANVERGFFEAPFPLLLSEAEPGARIRYTTDGTLPTESNGTDYTNAVTIGRTTVLRTAAFKTNMLPSLVQTHTYLFLDDILRQSRTNLTGVYTNSWSTNATYTAPDYDMDPKVVTNAVWGATLKSDLMAIPTLSIAIKPDDLFSTNNGIYTHTIQDGPYRGPLWTRKCSAELINADGSPGFQIDCGLKMQGGGSRDQNKEKKHPFALTFKGEYGATKLKYQMFADSPVQEFDKLYLRADYNNHWSHSDSSQRARGSMVRDALFKDVMGKMGAIHAHATYVHLYLNGIYWGVYGPAERQDGDFCAAYFGGNSSDYDAINGTGGQVVDGDNVARSTMLGLANANLADPGAYAALGQYLDIPQYIDYLILQYYGANQDWGTTKNWYAFRRRQPGAGYEYVAWDSERTLEDPAGRPMNVASNEVLNSVSPDNLQAHLVANREYRLAFADHAHKHFFNGGALTPAAMMASWQERAAMVYRALSGESARWGDIYTTTVPYTREGAYATETNRLFSTYFPARTGYVLNQFRLVGLYPTNVTAPTFSQFGGRVSRGFALTLSSPDPIYYTLNGGDPRVAGTEAVSSLAWAYTNGQPVILNSTTPVKARALQGATNWSALVEATFTIEELLPPLRLTEIMYNPVGGDAYEYIELKNLGALPVDLSFYTLEGLSYVFQPRSLLNPGAVLLLASSSSPNAFSNRYPGVTVFGRYARNLDNGGQRLALKDAAGRIVTSVDYNDRNGWPKATDGGGYSLEIVDPNGNPDDPANWRASAALNGTPGVAPTPPAPSPVTLSEAMAWNVTAVNHEGTYPDWIELGNSSSNEVDLSGWSLTTDDNPRKFVFPAGTTVPAGGWQVVWCDSLTNTTSGLHTGFGLDREGEFVFLYDANTNRVDAFSYGQQVADYSVGRIGGTWQLCLATPGGPNAAAPLASPTNLVLNEWLTDALPGQDDWVELYSRSATLPVALQGLYLGTSNQTHRLEWLSFLGPLGYVQLQADQNPGPNHVDFKLPGVNGGLMLYDAIGTVLDSVAYGATFQGVSMGRLPDGSSTVVSFPGSPSPAASNYVYAYSGPLLNEIMAANHNFLTNAWGHTADWIEIFNPNSTPFDLTGLSLSDDPNIPGQWVFPAGSIVEGYGFLVVWCDHERPASLSLEPELNAGVDLDGESDGVWLFNAARQPVDAVQWGFQVSDRSIGRVGGQWRLLASPTPGASNGAPAELGTVTALRINEWMANPASGDDWFELFNPQSVAVDLSGLSLANSPAVTQLTQSRIAPLSFIGAGGVTKWVADGNNTQQRNHAGFNLDAQGESILLYSTNLGVLDAVYYGPQTPGVSQGRLPDGGGAIVSFLETPTPGRSNYRPLGGLLINEVLARPAPPLEQAVEVYNAGLNPVDLGGLYLSDSAFDLKKFRVPDNTLVLAGGYAVFYEAQFNASPGATTSFRFNPAGGTVYLSAVDQAGAPTGYRAQVEYGAADAGVAVGRFGTSVGVDFVALSQPTFGLAAPATVEEFRGGGGASNAYPLVGPMVISEIMYHPADIGSTNDNAHDEYLELCNNTGTDLPLSDPSGTGQAWQLAGAVQYSFPQEAVLPAGTCVVLVGFDPSQQAETEDFRARYNIAAEVPILGPWQGQLNNAGETIELSKPGEPLPGGVVPRVLVDRVAYLPGYPWPMGADGGGASLQRTNLLVYGNEPLNWKAAVPTPGQANSPVGGQAPIVRSQPTNQVVAAGVTVVFSVVAEGDAPLSYQWRRNGLDLTNATEPTLTLTAVSAAQAGSYAVVVSNQFGSLSWAVGTLTVLSPPRITEEPTSQSVIEGHAVSFSVTATGDAPLRYRWRRNGVDVDNATLPTFTLSFAQIGDAADYAVVVANTAGAVTSAVATLTVLVPPRVSSQPRSLVIEFGTAASFEVAATGTSPLQYQWLFNSVPIPNATNQAYSLALPLPVHAGAYAVAVNNAAGTALSEAASLTVLTTRDSDHDGLTDYQEYLAGTDPRDALSTLRIEALAGPGAGGVRLRFEAVAGRSYAVVWSESVRGPRWEMLTNLPPQATTGPIEVLDQAPAGSAQRFYRLVTP